MNPHPDVWYSGSVRNFQCSFPKLHALFENRVYVVFDMVMTAGKETVEAEIHFHTLPL